MRFLTGPFRSNKLTGMWKLGIKKVDICFVCHYHDAGHFSPGMFLYNTNRHLNVCTSGLNCGFFCPQDHAVHAVVQPSGETAVTEVVCPSV